MLGLYIIVIFIGTGILSAAIVILQDYRNIEKERKTGIPVTNDWIDKIHVNRTKPRNP